MPTDEQTQIHEPSRPKVSDLKPSGFRESTWGSAAEASTGAAFQKVQFEVLEGQVATYDPMFERYDDAASIGQLPGGLGAAMGGLDEAGREREEAAAAAARAEEDRIALQAEHERQVQEAHAAGVEEGRAAAQQECDEKEKMLTERYASIIEDMNTQIQEGLGTIERGAVEFAVQIVKKLMGAAVEINPEYILEIIREAVKHTGGATIKTIRVSAQDLEFLKLLSPERQFKEFNGSWSFMADESIRSGCVIETSSGEVEYDLDKAWERVKESVVKVR